MKKKKYEPAFPWKTTREGESFFIPCLDTHHFIVLGKSSAYETLGRSARIVAVRGIFKGYLGVMFTLRKLPALQKPS
jgi:hypothetical protein